MLACSGLCNNSGLSHLFRKKTLPDTVIDLVGSGMVQIFSLEIDLRTAEIFRHLLRVVEPARTACIVVQEGF